MNNQVFSWLLFSLPWLTLLFMKKEEVRRYMPVGLFAVVTTVIIHDIGIGIGAWVVQTPSYPLFEMLPYFFGMAPVLTIWIFRFANGRFLYYMLANAAVDLGFSFYFLNMLLPAFGLYDLAGVDSFEVWLINLLHATTLYVYQKWQEGELLSILKMPLSPYMQRSYRKPFFEPDDDE